MSKFANGVKKTIGTKLRKSAIRGGNEKPDDSEQHCSKDLDTAVKTRRRTHHEEPLL